MGSERFIEGASKLLACVRFGQHSDSPDGLARRKRHIAVTGGQQHLELRLLRANPFCDIIPRHAARQCDVAEHQALGIRHQEFLHLLNARDIPTSWLAAIIDGQGRFIARVPQGATELGQLASEGWRATKDRTGIFEYPSIEGDMLIAAHVHPRIGNWTVGVAVKKAELRAAVWSTVRWAALLGAAISAASLLLAVILARQITRPIESLRQSFSDVPVGPVKPIVAGPPEIMELQDTLYRAAAERQSANQALMEALSKLEHEMALREDAQAALAKSQ